MLLKSLDALSERKVIILEGNDLKKVIFRSSLALSLISTRRRNAISKKIGWNLKIEYFGVTIRKKCKKHQ